MTTMIALLSTTTSLYRQTYKCICVYKEMPEDDDDYYYRRTMQNNDCRKWLTNIIKIYTFFGNTFLNSIRLTWYASRNSTQIWLGRSENASCKYFTYYQKSVNIKLLLLGRQHGHSTQTDFQALVHFYT